MAFIEKRKGLEIWESDGHGKACKGRKKTSSIQVRDYRGVSGGGYLLIKTISFTANDKDKLIRAAVKARRFIDLLIASEKSGNGGG